MNQQDPWSTFKSFTDARIALGRAGGGLPTQEWLKFRKDHAFAKDAVWTELNTFDLAHNLEALGLQHLLLNSCAINRAHYVQRPDLGRKLDDKSALALEGLSSKVFDVCLIIADGLSATAIHNNAVPFLEAFLPLVSSLSMAPVCIVKNGRVAIGDEIGESFGAKLSIVIIGERPGLSSPDSMGIYLTYSPKKGLTDEKRNCISNIRKGGLSYQFAAEKLAFLVKESIFRKISGVNLKDNMDKLLGEDGRK